jgi:hypothetical protein
MQLNFLDCPHRPHSWLLTFFPVSFLNEIPFHLMKWTDECLFWKMSVDGIMNSNTALGFDESSLDTLFGWRSASKMVLCLWSLSLHRELPLHHLHALDNKLANCSNARLSTSLKPRSSAQSISMIATTSPFKTIGTTISLLESPSHAMCPGKASTSGTSWVSIFSAAVPHTPLPNLIVWHATFPWKGPRISCLGVEESRT